ncbi:hypothetical protein B0H13DRAFT_1892388 [Mycena leptocephala]|nr:hypothetical protein B0H13DRAFT_1892388 [Mycena leptocephala]
MWRVSRRKRNLRKTRKEVHEANHMVETPRVLALPSGPAPKLVQRGPIMSRKDGIHRRVSLLPSCGNEEPKGTARKSFRSLKRQWNRANNVNAALRAEINSRNHRRSQRRVHKSEQIFRVLERYADKYKLNLAVLRDLLHQDYLSDEVSCPEDEMHETKEAWKFRMADLEAHRPSQTVLSPPPVVRPRSAESSPPPSIRRRSNPTIDLMRSVSPVEIRRPTFRTPAASADSVRQNLSGYSPALSGSCGCSELDYTLLDAFWGRVIFRNQPQLTTTSAPRPSFSIRCLDLTALLPYLACCTSGNLPGVKVALLYHVGGLLVLPAFTVWLWHNHTHISYVLRDWDAPGNSSLGTKSMSKRAARGGRGRVLGDIWGCQWAAEGRQEGGTGAALGAGVKGRQSQLTTRAVKEIDLLWENGYF